MSAEEILRAFSEVALEFKWKDLNQLIRLKKLEKKEIDGYMTNAIATTYKLSRKRDVRRLVQA